MRSLVILGLGETAQHWQTLPYTDMWTLPWSPHAYRATMWFEMHEPALWQPKQERLVEEQDIPILMQEHYDDIPMSKPYPLADAIDLGRDYFDSTIAYMLAYAALSNENLIGRLYDRVTLWGVDHITPDHQFDRPCNEYWIGLLQGMGTNVIVPAESRLLKHSRYHRTDGTLNIRYPRRYGYVEEAG